jgi:hypothetical protein
MWAVVQPDCAVIERAYNEPLLTVGAVYDRAIRLDHYRNLSSGPPWSH